MSLLSRRALFVCLVLVFAAGAAAAEEPGANLPLPRLRDGAFLESPYLKQPLTLADGTKAHAIELHSGGKTKVGLRIHPAVAEYNLFGDAKPLRETDEPHP